MQSDSPRGNPPTTPARARRYRPPALMVTALLALTAGAVFWGPAPFLAVPTIALGVFACAHFIWPIR